MPPYNWIPWMQQAILLAQDALPADIPVGAIILYPDPELPESTIIGRGWNSREKCANPAGHAEVMAMNQAAEALGTWRLSQCTLVVTLEPCPMCAAMALQSRVKRIVYGANSLIEGALGSAINLKTLYGYEAEIVAGICESEVQGMLQQFFNDRRESC